MGKLKSRQSLAVKYRPKSLEQLIGQEEIVSLLKGQFKSGGINQSFLISGPTGCGKCITEDSLILTPDGFMEIKDIIDQGSDVGFTEKGILVCNKSGEYEKTSHVFYEKAQETYQVTTETNFRIEGTPEHKLLCLDGMTTIWKRLDEITDGDYVAIQRGMNLWPEKIPDLMTEDLAVLLGYSRGRCVPSSILRSPKNIVAAFLRSFFEGDGGWDGDRISASSASETLIRQIQTVLLNFGIVSIVTSKVRKDVTYWFISIYSSNIDMFMSEIGFVSERKNDRYVSKTRSTDTDVLPRVGTYLDAISLRGQDVKISSYTGSPNWSYDHVSKYLEGRYQKIKDLHDLGYFWSKVSDIKKLDQEKMVYDVTLPRTHSFFANGFVNHNTSLARILAHYLNCENFDTENAKVCGVCEYCRDVIEYDRYGGVDEINFSDTRGIDTVRAVIESTAYASQYNTHVFICDEIQCLTGVAQNALLKILEEPPEDVVFLLLTTDPHKLLPTIHNRCCPLTIEKVSTDEIAKYLLRISKQDGRDYFTPKTISEDPKEAKAVFDKAYAIYKNIAMFSNGLVRQALATLEAVLSMVEGGEKIDTQDVETIRKLVGRFVDNPETEPNIAEYLISGIYSGRYGLSLSYALKLIRSSQSSSCQYLFKKALDYHLQTLYFFVDPKRKIANLTDEFYRRWYSSVIETTKAGKLYVTHQSASEIVQLFMNLISEMSLHQQDEDKLVVAYTLKMLDAVQKYRHNAYTSESVFHKVYAPPRVES